MSGLNERTLDIIFFSGVWGSGGVGGGGGLQSKVGYFLKR